MATVIHPNGTQEEVQPENGQDFQLKELQTIVGGHIEIIPTRDQRIMVLNEEGKLQDLPYNEQATALVNLPSPEEIKALKALMGDSLIIAGDPDEADYIVGTVLVCKDREVR